MMGALSRLKRSIFISTLVYGASSVPAAGAQSGKVDGRMDLVIRYEVTIDRPLDYVWSRFVDIRSWMSHLQFDEVSGPPNDVGELRRVTQRGQTGTIRSYHIKTIHVEPLKRFVVKVLPGEGIDHFGFAAFNFESTGKSTKVVYDIYVEMDRAAVPEAPSTKETVPAADNPAPGVLARLKQFVETGKRPSPSP